MDVFDKIIEKSKSSKLNQKLDKILALDKTFSSMTDEQLKQKSAELMQRRQNGESEKKLMTEAFALVREATWRTLGMKQYPVQLKGGISIAEGNLAEMATGEGKTIVVPLVAYLHALSGENVHVVTSNEYLAKRDSEQMSKLFGFLGMEVGLSTSRMNTVEKQAAYSCNVTYTTASELGFDYLRDNDTPYANQKVLRGLNSIVIDEADHTLLDDASTPLILAAQEQMSKQEKGLLNIVSRVIDSLQEEVDYEVEKELNLVSFSEEGIDKLEKFFMIDNLFVEENRNLLEYCNNALRAKALFEKDVHYVVKNGKVEIVGETIGRILEGRKYEYGLHQAIEAKEGVDISSYSTQTSNINFQNFFKMFENLGGLSGTCKTDEEELEKIYGLSVDKIETNKPVIRTDDHFRFYHTIDAKNEALKQRILELHNSGRPILLGTTSVENSVQLADILKEMGLEFNLLNAINEEEESKIIAQAGRLGAITIATNMAGRGTDIKLGGNPTEMAKEDMKKLGFSHALISFADSHLQPKTEQEKEARNKFNELKSAHKKVTDAEKEKVMAAGGLAVVGTALNSSRRVDNQLRGRAGRQGEPGSSEIFVSWQDVKDTFAIGDDKEDEYLTLLKKHANKKSVDPTKEITDKKIIDFIENIQIVSESKSKQSREWSFNLNTPEHLQKTALFSEKEEIIKLFDEFDPNKVEISENPHTKLESYFLKLYQDDISKIIDEWVDGKKSKSDINPKENMTTEDFKISGDYLRKRLEKYAFDASIISDNFLMTHQPNEIKELISTRALNIFQKTIIETRDIIPELSHVLKTDVVESYKKYWSDHIKRLDKAKFQLSLASADQNALNYFVRDSYNFFQLLKDQVRTNIIKTTTKDLVVSVNTVRGVVADREKQAKQKEQIQK